MSVLLFNIVIDWVLCRATKDKRKGLRWTPSTVLEDLDYYANDICYHILFVTSRTKLKGLRDSLKR